MKKICFVIYDLSIVGGVERVVEGIANKLASSYKVHVVSLHGTEKNVALYFDKSIVVDFLRLSEGRLRKQMLEGTRKLGQYLRINAIDIAFLESTFPGFIGCLLGILSKTKIVFCDHGALLNQINDKQITIMRRMASCLSNQIVVLTKRSKIDYERLFRVKKEKITYIYNWISETLIDSGRQYNTASKTIVTAGRFTKEKGVDLLVEVARKVYPLRNGWEWHIYGEGPLEEEMRKRIQEYGLKDFLYIKGFSSNMAEVYRNAAMYVLPSYREGVPLVLLEAKAFKLPLISFDILTGPSEIIEDKKNGYLINPYNTELMAETIVNLIKEPSKRKELSDNAYSNIDKFREIKIYNQWINLIDHLLEAR